MKTKAVIFGLFLLATFPGFAAEGEIEEVLVIGTRASLMSAVEKQAVSDKITRWWIQMRWAIFQTRQLPKQ